MSCHVMMNFDVCGKQIVLVVGNVLHNFCIVSVSPDIVSERLKL